MRYSAIFLTVLLLTFAGPVGAQITITSADLPAAGDTFRISTSTPVSGLDLTTTGANVTWDFSTLVSAGQTVDTFLSVGNTASVFSVIFSDVTFNPNRANQATRGQAFNLGTVNVSDVFNFYYNSSTVYEQPGIGARVNGVQLPIVFSPHDVHYRFPLEYGDTDVSPSGYELDLTSTVGFFFQVRKTRDNVVDGWGTVITPLGAFNALRVKSTVVEQDSVYIDSLGTGFNLPAITTIEYKWLAPGQGIPVLQITTTGTGTVTSIRYRDQPQVSGLLDPVADVLEPVVYPNPAAALMTLRWESPRAQTVPLRIFDLSGGLVYEEVVEAVPGVNLRMVPTAALRLANGVYRMQIGHRELPVVISQH